MSNKTIKYFPEVAKEEHEDVTNPPTKRILLYGWDPDNLQKVRVKTDSNGNIKIDPTNLDSRYVNVSGDTMTGDLNIEDNELLITSPNGSSWTVTVGNDGNLITEQYSGPVDIVTGNPMGAWLFWGTYTI